MSSVGSLVRAALFLCAWLVGLSVTNPAFAEAPNDAPGAASPHLPPLPDSFVRVEDGQGSFSADRGVADRIPVLASAGRAARATLGDLLGGEALSTPIEVRIARDMRELRALSPEDAPPPEYGVGVAYPGLRLIVVSLKTKDGAASDAGVIFKHELSHVALGDATRGRDLPLWFNEGFAIYVSREDAFDRLHTLWRATLSNSLLPMNDLSHGFPTDPGTVEVAYAQSADFVRFLLRQEDHERFSRFLSRLVAGQPFRPAISDAYGSDLGKLEVQWRRDIESRYDFWPLLTGGSFLSGLVLVGLTAAYIRKKRHVDSVTARWAREEERLRAFIAEQQALAAVAEARAAASDPNEPS